MVGVESVFRSRLDAYRASEKQIARAVSEPGAARSVARTRGDLKDAVNPCNLFIVSYAAKRGGLNADGQALKFWSTGTAFHHAQLNN